MNVLIIGCGNAGSGIAADIALKGHAVSMFKTSRNVHIEHFEVIRAELRLTLTEKGQCREARLRQVTDNVERAFDPLPEVIIVATQTGFHANIFDQIRPHLRDGITILLEPGNASSLVLLKGQVPKGLRVAEATSTPVDVRIGQPGNVDVLFRNVRNPLGIFPLTAADDILGKLQELYANFYLIGCTLIAALHNPNLIVHTVGSLLSVPRIEYSKGDFWMYKEGFTKSVWNVIMALDEEKMEVIERLGGERIEYLEIAKSRNAENLSINAREMFEIYCQTGSPKGPANVDTRYIHEDVPKGLVLLESLGKLVRVNTPTASMLIHLAELYTGKNFRRVGSTLEYLGIDRLQIDDLLEFLNSGIRPDSHS